jgi:hypothetical protein
MALTVKADEYAAGLIRLWTELLSSLEDLVLLKDDRYLEGVLLAGVNAADKVEAHISELMKFGGKPISAAGLHRDVLVTLLEIDTPGSKLLYEITQKWVTIHVRRVYGLLLAFGALQTRRYDEAVEIFEITPFDTTLKDRYITWLEDHGPDGRVDVMHSLQTLLKEKWARMSLGQPGFVRDALNVYIKAPVER